MKLKTSQIIYLILGIIFSIFAIIQYNDSDFYIWIPIYGWVAFLAFSAMKGKYWQAPSILSAILLFVWIIIYTPSVWAWYKEGSPSIAGSMKAENPYIEYMREFLGLLLCLVAILHFYFRSKNSIDE